MKLKKNLINTLEEMVLLVILYTFSQKRFYSLWVLTYEFTDY